jgi:hypothetical protein
MGCGDRLTSFWKDLFHPRYHQAILAKMICDSASVSSCDCTLMVAYRFVNPALVEWYMIKY